MPTVLREAGYQFIIFTSDHYPPHVHVRREGKLAKLLLNLSNLSEWVVLMLVNRVKL
ncbi:MAG: DUF4160 domain-containing protein [Anaerolineaceae bacterium]|nr:DUF4160 domain-containing protein [Anaerolineaceae bacterium]